jgi:hypothetical protein
MGSSPEPSYEAAITCSILLSNACEAWVRQGRQLHLKLHISHIKSGRSFLFSTPRMSIDFSKDCKYCNVYQKNIYRYLAIQTGCIPNPSKYRYTSLTANTVVQYRIQALRNALTGTSNGVPPCRIDDKEGTAYKYQVWTRVPLPLSMNAYRSTTCVRISHHRRYYPTVRNMLGFFGQDYY